MSYTHCTVHVVQLQVADMLCGLSSWGCPTALLTRAWSPLQLLPVTASMPRSGEQQALHQLCELQALNLSCELQALQ